jgi:CheY-like chemotaxis protein
MQEIFLVHDEQESAATRKSLLEMAGYHVTTMRTGTELLEALEVQVPALVLMDVLLEGPTGFDVCRQVRARFTSQKLPILLSCTLYRSRVYRDEALAAGAQGYVLRPVKLEDLVEQVAEVLSGHTSPVQAA